MGCHEGADQPAPNRTLVVSAIALPPIPAVMTDEGRIARRQAAQAMRREQLVAADRDDGDLSRVRQGAVRQRDGKELVGPQGRIVPERAVNHVVAVAGRVVPETGKSGAGLLGQGFVIRGRLLQP